VTGLGVELRAIPEEPKGSTVVSVADSLAEKGAEQRGTKQFDNVF
jgi:hypothetical protein